MAVSDAYKRMPFAEVLYSCDAAWWDVHKGCASFVGEKWSSHDAETNNKLDAAARYGLNLVQGRTQEGFSFDPCFIHYGSNSGFQAINLAVLFGAKRILLVGFDMSSGHFFGEHPDGLTRNKDYRRFIPEFNRAAALVPAGIEIINCAPGSALQCFPKANLTDALSASPRH